MIANKLELKDFRNYKHQLIELSDGVNVFYGNNAQGKTNILEAIYMFALGSSYRTTKDSELILFDKEKTNIRLDFFSHNMEQVIEIEVEKSKKKIIKINECKIDKISEMVGKLDVVLLCPENLGLIKDGPSVRRKNLDILISQLKPRYFKILKQYKKIILNKNILLKKIRNKPDLVYTLPVWNEKIAELGAEIIRYRKEYIERLDEICRKIHNNITTKKEMFHMKYECSIGSISSEGLKEAILERIEKNKKKELEYAESIVGPHRDDILFYINDREIKRYASQGQQKTAVLTHKLAEVEIIKQELGEYPILMLDDVMSELDSKRQEFIVNKIKGMQVIVTCTDKEMFKDINSAKLFNVKKGKVKE